MRQDFPSSFRALGTPNNEVWPEVESLQDYKNTFPKWKPGSLASHVKNLDENGLDLLSVSALFLRAGAQRPCVFTVTEHAQSWACQQEESAAESMPGVPVVMAAFEVCLPSGPRSPWCWTLSFTSLLVVEMLAVGEAGLTYLLA